MKKFLGIIGLAVSAFMPIMVSANQSLSTEKIDLIMRIYEPYQYQYDVDDSYNNAMNIFNDNLTPSFKNFLKQSANIADEIGDDAWIGCFNYDFIIQGQDYDAREIRQTLTPQLLKNGNVKVDFTNFSEDVTLQYVFQCENNRCLIDDIIEEETGSYRQTLSQCLQEIQ